MNKRKKMHILGFFFTIILGTLLHFTYEWSGNNNIVAAFSAINESVWEHLKLLFYPVFIFTFAEFFVYGKNKANFFVAKALSLFIGMSSIVTIFYTYTGIFGTNFFIVDILTFVFSVFITYLISYKIMSSNLLRGSLPNIIGFILLIAYLILFIVFTYYPPQVNLFIAP